MNHDRQPYLIDSLILRDAGGRTESLQRNLLGIWGWVEFTPQNFENAHPIDLADEGFIQLYNPSEEQYMSKSDYDQMKLVECGFSEDEGGFTRAEGSFASETHHRLTEWDKPLEEHEQTPGNLLWRDTVERIAKRAEADHAIESDEDRFARGMA